MSKPTYEVTKRYRDKAIGRVAVDLRKELVEEWTQALREDHISKAAFLRDAINAYLDSRKKDQ